MMHKAWSRIEEVSYVFQGHTSNCKVTRLKKIVNFDQNWAFRDCNSSLNSLMDFKWCTKLGVLWKRWPIFSGSSIKFQCHTGWKIDDMNPIWVRLLDRSQLSNPSDLAGFYMKHVICFKPFMLMVLPGFYTQSSSYKLRVVIGHFYLFYKYIAFQTER